MNSSPERHVDDVENIQSEQNDTDLADNARDERVMREEEIVIDLPDVADIPGQENIIPPKMGMFADTPISSDGEEGAGIFEEEDDEEP